MKKMITELYGIKPTISAVLLAMALPLSSEAQVIYSEDFVGPNGSIPSGWSTTVPDSMYIQDNQLRYAEKAINTYDSQSFAPGFEATWNFRINSNVISLADQANVFFFGYNDARDPGDGPVAYSVGIRKFNLNAPMYLAISPQPQAAYNSPYLSRIQIDTLYSFNNTTIYTINVFYDGSSIAASLYDGDHFIAEVIYNTNVAAITGKIGTYGRSTSLTDSIEISAIPEPSTFVYVGMLGLIALVGRRVYLRRNGGA